MAEGVRVQPGISEIKVDHPITDSRNEVYRAAEQAPHGGAATRLQVPLAYLERPGVPRATIVRLIGHTPLMPQTC